MKDINKEINGNTSEDTNETAKKSTNKNTNLGMTMGMCFGMAIGASWGLLFDHMAMGVAMGLCLGMLIGFAFGSRKDKLVNEQMEKEGYTIKEILPKENQEYVIVIEGKSGETKEIATPGGIMETEQFSVGDTVFLDEDGMLEQAFDDEEE
ncbi:MAG: hypothetical protein IKT57_08880 [Clostridia bacterium]|nr:hypothetical protein [Clostridia bacterium]